MKKNSTILIVVAVTTLVLLSGILLIIYYSSQPNSNQNSSTKQEPSFQSTATLSSAPQVSQFLTEYPIPSRNSLPNAIAVDSSGNVWTVLQNLSALGEFNPASGTFRVFALPEPKGTQMATWGIAVDNARHLVWFSDEISNAIWSFNTTSLTFKEYSIKTPAGLPFQVALDSKGNVWFTEFTGNKIGEISVDGVLTEMSIPIAPAEPTGIAIDTKQDRVWFNLLETGGITSQFYIGSYYKGSFTFDNVTKLVDTPVGIAVDTRGNIWLTQHGASFISEYNRTNGYFRTISTSIPAVGASYPYFCYTDPRTGNVWFNEHYGNAIGEFNSSTNSLIEYEIPSKLPSFGNISGALTMNLSPSGVPWFSELYSGKLGFINTSVPLGLSLTVGGGQTSVSIMMTNQSESTSLELSVSGANNQAEYLSASIANFTGHFQFYFAQFTGNGNFGTTMTINNTGSEKGVYFATISVKTQNLIVSQVIEIVVG